MKTILFACVHNAGRSQMAASFFNALADLSKACAISAGTQPAGHIHPEVLASMREAGIDLSNAQPTKLSDALAREAQLLVTMGCSEQCPLVPGLEVVAWSIADPKGQSAQRVAEIRDEIRRSVTHLISEREWSRESR